MHPSWRPFLTSEFEKPYFRELSEFLKTAYSEKTIFPPKALVFRAFWTDLNSVKVVILGQDPYHTPGAAEGLAFSVPDSAPIPPSLINIYKEIDADVGRHKNPTGHLENWQKQGVMLLNTVLTVEAHKAGSHRGRGWETFTTAVIKYLNETRPHLLARKRALLTMKNILFWSRLTLRPFPRILAFLVTIIFRSVTNF